MQLYEWLATLGAVIQDKGAVDWELPVVVENEHYVLRASVESYCRIAINFDYPVIPMRTSRPVGIVELGEPGEKADYRRIILKVDCWVVNDPPGRIEELVFKMIRYEHKIWNIVLCNRCMLWQSHMLQEWINNELLEGFKRAIHGGE